MPFEVTTKMDSISEGLLPDSLDRSINEKLLLHGTAPETVQLILRNGFNERFSDGLLGSGIYLAEDPAKIDQYAKIDRAPSENLHVLHDHLYKRNKIPHPGKVFYAFVSRVALGFPVYTLDAENVKRDPAQKVFATEEKRQLSDVPGSVPATAYHSLICEVGGLLQRHREFCIYNAHNILPEYVVSYRRIPKKEHAA